MRKTLLLTLTLGLLVNLASAQIGDTIIAWTFPDTATNAISWEGLESNKGKYEVFAYNSDESVPRTISMKNGVTGDPDNAAQAEAWDDGANDKCWYLKFKAENYENMKLSAKITSGGSKPGPGNFKTQYRIGSDGTWTDISGSEITTANDWTTGVLDGFALPVELDNPAQAIHIRFIMTDNLDHLGGTVASNGTSKIDDIFITGDLIGGTTSINNLQSFKTRCFPNPSTGVIQFNSNSKIESVNIYSVIGELVYTNSQITDNKIDLSDIKKGMYIIQMNDQNNNIVTEKILLR
jgi:Secretion system C-terminal sorting domain